MVIDIINVVKGFIISVVFEFFFINMVADGYLSFVYFFKGINFVYIFFFVFLNL